MVTESIEKFGENTNCLALVLLLGAVERRGAPPPGSRDDMIVDNDEEVERVEMRRRNRITI